MKMPITRKIKERTRKAVADTASPVPKGMGRGKAVYYIVETLSAVFCVALLAVAVKLWFVMEGFTPRW